MCSAPARETFPVLPGANDNAGGRYEYLLCCYVSLKLLHDPVVKDFKLSNNSEDFGKFDDIVAEITFQDGSTETWAMQLKHNANGKLITRNELAAANKGDFSVNMYFKDHQARTHPTNTKSVLYTNRTLQEGQAFLLPEKQHPITTIKSKTIKSNITCPLESFDTSKDCSVYQFNIEGEAEDNEVKSYKDFFRNFYIFANQKNVGGMEQEVMRVFTAAYGSVGGDKYIKMFGNWCMGTAIRGRKEKLYKEDIEREIARIVLERHVQPIESKVSCVNGNTLKTIISKFDITVIDAGCGNLIEHLWASCDPPHNWNADFPVILTVNEANKTSVHEAVNVLSKDHKFILVGDCVDVTKFETRKIFENLSQLETDDFKDVADSFSCVIQGRESTCLGEILKGNENLERFFKVGHLLEMVEKPLVIGDETVALPKPYLNRSIPKHIFKSSVIRNQVENEVFVITCSDRSKLLETVNGNKSFESTVIIDITKGDFVIEPTKIVPLILISTNKISARGFQQICSKIVERSVLYFELCEGFLNLLSTHDCKLSKLIQFRDADRSQTIRDSEILSNFMNKTNVLLADPGMGKTICAEFIKRICPFDVWPIKIHLREKLHLFRNSSGVEDLLGEILYSGESALLKSFQNYYKSNKQILLIWDGLDEVGTANVSLVIDKIKEISHCGYSQWLSSRYHLKETLESFFNVLSVTLTEITPEDQQKYIEDGLLHVYDANIQEVATNIYERIVNNKLKDMLGIPLLLHMFTTICSNPQHYESIRTNDVSITQIYGMFVDGNFDKHSTDKVEKTGNPFFSQMLAEFKAYRKISYSEAAMITCFDNEFLENVKLECDNFFLQYIAQFGDCIGFITTIADNESPIFWHKTFAEYFAALYLKANHERLGSEILFKLFQPEYKNIRLLFDMCLSENQPAHQAVLAMNLNKLKEIAEKNENMIFWKDDGGRNALHLACSYGTMREPLIPFSDDKYITDSRPKQYFKTFTRPPLNIAKEEKVYAEILKTLVDLANRNGQNVNYEDKIYGMNCLQYADASLSLHAIESLLEIFEVRKVFKRFLRNYKDSDETLLTYSIILGYENIVRFFERLPYFELLKNDVDYKPVLNSSYFNLRSCNLFILIIEFGRTNMLKDALVSYTENVISNLINTTFKEYRSGFLLRGPLIKITPLFWTVTKGNLDIFKLLLQHGADLEIEYGEDLGNNILHVAVEQDQMNIVKHIVEEKLVDVDIRNKPQETPLLVASRTGRLNIINYLIEKGAAVDATNLLGRNMFHCACSWDQLETVQDLVENKQYPLETLEKLPKKSLTLYTQDNEGNDPLLLSASKGHFEIVEYLLRNGANINTKNDKSRNILHYACTYQQLTFINSLPKEKLLELDTQDKWGFNPILQAASENDFDIVRYLLENGANINTKNDESQNILHYACTYRQLTFINSLPKEKLLELDTQDRWGFNPILQAASENDFDIVQYLLENGANINTKNDESQNILHYACTYQQLTFINSLPKEKLLELDTQDKLGYNPILRAGSKNCFEIVQYLLENGANINAKNDKSRNILHYACTYQQLTFINSLPKEKLLELDTQDKLGYNPILRAGSKNCFDIVQYLLENGANINTKNDESQNILHYACTYQQSTFINSLPKEKLLELDTRDKLGYNPILRAGSKDCFDIVQYLLENGANINTKNDKSQNIVHYACTYQQLTFIKSLPKEKLLELDTQDKWGFNPISQAASKNDFDIVQYLLEIGANINTENFLGQNILHYACLYQKSSFIKSLPKKKLLELDIQSAKGYNPLLFAASKGYFDIVQYLLENGAINIKTDISYEENFLHHACRYQESTFINSLPKEMLIECDTRNYYGFNPLLVAASNGHFHIVQHLLENGANFKTKDNFGENILHFASRADSHLEMIKKYLTPEDIIELNYPDSSGRKPLGRFLLRKMLEQPKGYV